MIYIYIIYAVLPSLQFIMILYFMQISLIIRQFHW